MVSGMIPIPASLRSDLIHIPGTLIHIALESTIHIVGIRTWTTMLDSIDSLWVRFVLSCPSQNLHTMATFASALLVVAL